MAQVAPAQGLTPAYDVKEGGYDEKQPSTSPRKEERKANTTPLPVKPTNPTPAPSAQPSKTPLPTNDPPQSKSRMGYPAKSHPPDYNSATCGPAARGGTMIINTQPMVHQTTIIHHYHVEPTNYMVLAIFTLVCCNVLLGGVAIAFSLLSSTAYNEGDIEGARAKGKISLAISVAGITITVVALLSISIYLIVVLTS